MKTVTVYGQSILEIVHMWTSLYSKPILTFLKNGRVLSTIQLLQKKKNANSLEITAQVKIKGSHMESIRKLIGEQNRIKS